ncbi:MAG: hypothetical protein P4L50_06935 [Anaerolineaceae bacterium]|nr:hypothetical protein [Anaerolineaceae bacterium]
MKYFLVVLALILPFPNLAFSQEAAVGREKNVCKKIVFPKKTFAYLVDEDFNKVGDEVNLGEIYSTKESDGFISGRKFFVVASKNLIDDDPFLSSKTQRVTLVKTNFICKDVNIFKVELVILNPTVIGKPGAIVGEFPYIALDNYGLFDVQRPKKFTGNLKMYELDFYANGSPKSSIEVNPKNNEVTTMTLINNGSISVKPNNWVTYYDKDAHWAEIFENQCANRELKPKEICTAKIRWGKTEALGDKQSWKSAVELDDSSIKLEVTRQENGNYQLKLGEEFSTE